MTTGKTLSPTTASWLSHRSLRPTRDRPAPRQRLLAPKQRRSSADFSGYYKELHETQAALRTMVGCARAMPVLSIRAAILSSSIAPKMWGSLLSRSSIPVAILSHLLAWMAHPDLA